MFNLGMGEITVVLVLALIFIGPKKLPELASGLGKLIREIRKTTSDVKNEIQLDDAIRKPFEELREAVTLHPEELKRRDRIRRDLEAAQKSAAEITAKMEAARTNGVAAPDAAAPAALGTESTVPVTANGAAPSDVPATPTAAPIGTIARSGSSRVNVPAVPATGTPPGYVPPPPPSLTSPAPPPPPAASRPSVQEDLGDMLRRLSEVHHRNTGRMAAVTTPAAPLPDSAADRSNTTQSLSEADLAAIAVGPSASPPPPPPRATRSGRIVAPPMPGLTEAAPKPAAPSEEKKPDPAT